MYVDIPIYNRLSIAKWKTNLKANHIPNYIKVEVAFKINLKIKAFYHTRTRDTRIALSPLQVTNKVYAKSVSVHTQLNDKASQTDLWEGVRRERRNLLRF